MTCNLSSIRSCLLVLFAVAFAFLSGGCHSSGMVVPADLDRLTGAPWAGTLTYRDYGTGKETTIESTLEVVKAPGLAEIGNDFADAGVRPGWEFRIGYPREPKANSSFVVRISPDGKRLQTDRSDETVTSRIEMPDGALLLTTEERGMDNERPAVLQFLYAISQTSFSMTKRVRPEGEPEFFDRNKYRWSR